MNIKRINIGKVVKFLVNHTDEAVNLAQSIKALNTGADKKAAVMEILSDGIKLGDFTQEEQMLALLPECQVAWDAVMETRVAAMKAEASLRLVLEHAKQIHGSTDIASTTD